MTTRCPTHNKPLVRTFGGSEICLPCYFAKRREDRKTVISMTSKPAATLSKQSEYAREYYRKTRGPKKMAERAASSRQKAAGTGRTKQAAGAAEVEA